MSSVSENESCWKGESLLFPRCGPGLRGKDWTIAGHITEGIRKRFVQGPVSETQW